MSQSLTRHDGEAAEPGGADQLDVLLEPLRGEQVVGLADDEPVRGGRVDVDHELAGCGGRLTLDQIEDLYVRMISGAVGM